MIRSTTVSRNLVPCVLVLLLFPMLAAPAFAENAQEVFETLKSFEGTWKGSISVESLEAGSQDLVHEFRLAANGSVVMETMNPGTEGEMINMYYMDGDDLVLTHYCSAGNQPKMKLSADSDANHMVFEFDGGTNIDKEAGPFIHDADFKLVDGTLHSTWRSFMNGKLSEQAVTFFLKRD